MIPRRTPLALVAVLVVAGCLGTFGGSSGDGSVEYETHVFDHVSAEAPAIEGGLQYPTGSDEPRPFHLAVVTSADGVDRFNRTVLDDEAERFVDETDFDRSFLVVFEAFPASSSPDYRVERAERTDGTLHVAVDDSSDGGTDDVTVETLLVRVDRGGAPVPDEVTVTTEEGDTVTYGGADPTTAS